MGKVKFFGVIWITKRCQKRNFYGRVKFSRIVIYHYVFIFSLYFRFGASINPLEQLRLQNLGFGTSPLSASLSPPESGIKMIEKLSSSDLEALLLRKRAEEVLKKQQEEEAARLKLQEDEAARQVGKLKVTIFNPCLGKGSKKKKKLMD